MQPKRAHDVELEIVSVCFDINIHSAKKKKSSKSTREQRDIIGSSMFMAHSDYEIAQEVDHQLQVLANERERLQVLANELNDDAVWVAEETKRAFIEWLATETKNVVARGEEASSRIHCAARRSLAGQLGRVQMRGSSSRRSEEVEHKTVAPAILSRRPILPPAARAGRVLQRRTPSSNCT